ncbi:unnamed protein product, partial [Didymodactylos carnosus]
MLFDKHLITSRQDQPCYAEDVETKLSNEITNVKLSTNDKNVIEAVLNGAKYKIFIKSNIKGVRYSTVEDPKSNNSCVLYPHNNNAVKIGLMKRMIKTTTILLFAIKMNGQLSVNVNNKDIKYLNFKMALGALNALAMKVVDMSVNDIVDDSLSDRFADVVHEPTSK